MPMKMSVFGKPTNKKKKEKNGKSMSVQEVIQQLKQTEMLLSKRQEFLESKIENEVQLVKKYAKSNKRLALQALRRKKRYETYLQQIDGTLSTVEIQRECLESAATDSLVIDNMKLAAEALKTAHKKLDVDEVHDVMDDIAEEKDKAKEIAEAISKPVSFGYDIDEDELEKELEELEQEELDTKLLGINLPSTSTQLPSPPKDIPGKVKKPKTPVDDEEELKTMDAWAS